MKDWFLYVFYRASKFYKSFGEKYYYISGKFLLFLALCANILSIVGLFCLILKTVYKLEVIYGLCALFAILSFFILDEKDYNDLEEKYQNEENSKRRGYMVLFYIIASVILYFVSLSFIM